LNGVQLYHGFFDPFPYFRRNLTSFPTVARPGDFHFTAYSDMAKPFKKTGAGSERDRQTEKGEGHPIRGNAER
jgi:hypothetical protein